MKNIIAVVLMLTAACNPQPDQPTAAPNIRPNIVWLVSEDLSPYIPAFGDSTIETPNLSRLAAEGMRYTNVFSPSGVCAPSRFALATGMYPSGLGGNNMRTGGNPDYHKVLGTQPYEVVTPPEVKMMSQIMRENGYYCTNNDKQDYQFAAPKAAWDETSRYAHWRNRPKEEPFFSIFNFAVTHESQFFGPPSLRNLRYREGFPETKNDHAWGDRIDSADWILNVPDDLAVTVPPYLPDNQVVRNDIRVMYSNIIEMDKQVGLLLKQLEDDGLLENTIIFWYTDHGGPLPRQKRLMYDSGLKVPLIIRYPGQIGAGKIEDQLISFIDFAPTTFSLAGIEPPLYLNGRAFAGEFESQTPRKYIHAAADRLDMERDMIRAVRDSRYKYLRNFNPDQGYYLPITYRERISTMQELLRLRDAGELNEFQMQWFRESKPEEELFDTWNDPHELNNIAQNPDQAVKLEELRNECSRWMEDIDDKGAISEADLISLFWPDWDQPGTSNPAIQLEEGLLSITCSTPGANVVYQVKDPGQEPSDQEWEVYVGSTKISKGKTVYAQAHRIGFKPSEIVGS